MNLSIQELADHIVSNSIKLSMDDNTWRRIGFKSRPKYGMLFQKFRKNWEVKLETELMRELLLIYLSYGVKSYSDHYQPELIIDEILFKFDENKNGLKLWQSLDFKSNKHCLEFMKLGITSLYEKENTEWLSDAGNRINFKNVNDKKLKANILVGLAELTSALPDEKV